MVKVIYSSVYNEYKVLVSGSTYYTDDKQDALNTCRLMAKEQGIDSDVVVSVKKATTKQEENW
jgi:hypothetical protein